MKSIEKLFLLSFLIPLVFGCSEGRPANVPKLEPVTITIFNGDSPIVDAIVGLGWQGVPGNWMASGQTDSSGVATIFTQSGSWRGAGAPVGEYKVILSKVPKLEPLLSREEVQKLESSNPAEFERHQAREARRLAETPRKIPVVFIALETTPLILTVEDGAGANQIYDVGKTP